MKAMLKTLLVVGAVTFLFVGESSTARADHNPYWRGYWHWYDNTYTPYYNNYYSPDYYYGPSYGGYYGPSYGGGYYAPQYNSGYYVAPGPSVGVQVGRGRGRVSFGWW